MRSILMAVTLAVGVVPPRQVEELRGEELMRALKGGGYTIVLRHTRTDRSFQEEIASIPPTRALQRNLSDDGVRDARLIGRVLKRYQVPIGDVVSSPMYRATETAEYAVGRQPAIDTALRTFPSPAKALAILATRPRDGTNRLVVTHHFVIETHVPGITPGAINESEAAVVRPRASGGVELVGRILLSDWVAMDPGASATPVGGTAAAVVSHGAAPEPAHPAMTMSAVPPTPLVQVVLGYVDAFNTGDVARMQAFLERNFTANPARTMEERLTAYEQLHRQLGAITLLGADAVSDSSLTMVGRGATGILRLVATPAPGKPGTLMSLSFRMSGAPR
ncbi:MAG: histidine phosphatase family protein [Gemmatimonadetes bacterium]|nr:histidine phosphatase family protein [Gemmatimonadota bacterium]